MSALGKQIRLHRILGEDGRLVSVMFDHTIARGILPGLSAIEEKLQAVLAAKPDTVTVQRGIADQVYIRHIKPEVSLVLKATSPTPYDKTYAAVLANVEDAVRRSADAIAVGCVVGGARQAEGMEQASALIREAEKWGLPVIGHFYPNGENIPAAERESWQNVAYAARVGAELGVDILKIHHSGNAEELARIAQAVPAKLVLAGGNSGSGIRSYLEMAHHTVEAGIAGIAFGRAVWSYPNPTALVHTLKMIIHQGWSVDEAMEYLGEHVDRSAV